MHVEYQSSYKSVLGIITDEYFTIDWLKRKCTNKAIQDAINKKMIRFYDKSELGIDRYIITELGKKVEHNKGE